MGHRRLSQWPRSLPSPPSPRRSGGREPSRGGESGVGTGGLGRAGAADAGAGPEEAAGGERGLAPEGSVPRTCPGPAAPAPPRPGPGRRHRLPLRPAPPARTLPPGRARAVPGHVSRGAGPRGRAGCGMERRKVFVALDVLCLAVGEGSVAAPPGASPRPAGVPGAAAPGAGAKSPGGTAGPGSPRASARSGPWPVPPVRGQRGRHLPGRCRGSGAPGPPPRATGGTGGGGRAPAPAPALPGSVRGSRFSGPFPFPGAVPRGGGGPVCPGSGRSGRVARLGRHRGRFLRRRPGRLPAAEPGAPRADGAGPVGSGHPF